MQDRENDPADSVYLSIITPGDLMACNRAIWLISGITEFQAMGIAYSHRDFARSIQFALGPCVHFVQEYQRAGQSVFA
ncbi:MAG: hypothetical protein R3B47_10460 [Bacteroidia bacterium]